MTDELKMHKAVKSGDLAAVEKLYAEGCDVNYDDVNLGTPIYQAIAGKKLDVLQFLVNSAGADVNGQIFTNQFCPLSAAIVHNNKQAFEFLMENSLVDVNHKDKVGDTPMMFCIKHNREKMADELNYHSAFEPNVENNRRRTALMEAVAVENEHIVYILLGNKYCEADFENDMGESALSLAKGVKNTKILIAVEDKVLPELGTSIGRALVINKQREHCKRFYDLKLREAGDITALQVDDKWLSWKGNVENARDRVKILEVFSVLKKDPSAYDVAVASAIDKRDVLGKMEASVPFANIV